MASSVAEAPQPATAPESANKYNSLNGVSVGSIGSKLQERRSGRNQTNAD